MYTVYVCVNCKDEDIFFFTKEEFQKWILEHPVDDKSVFHLGYMKYQWVIHY